MNVIKPDFSKNIGEVNFSLYDKFNITISIDDWLFMCKNRWFSDEPLREDVEAEFGVCGARSAKDNKEANMIVNKTIGTYKRIMQTDIEKDCRKTLNSTSKTVARIDKNGNIYFEEDKS